MRSPMIIATAASLINVGLDPLLIFTFGWGLDGAAWASTISQVVACVWAVFVLRRTYGADLRLDRYPGPGRYH